MGHSLVQTIKDRIALYREAEQVATAQGEGGKARRAARGLRTLQVFSYSNLMHHLKLKFLRVENGKCSICSQELERKAARGGAVSEEEIPPPISTGRRCF